MAEAVSGMTGSLQGSVTGLANKGTQWLDSIFPPEKRNAMIAKLTKFMNEKPMFASFLASHIALTGFPLGLFVVMTISIAIFAILAALILGLVGAVLFIVTCVGFALIILLPTIFITTGIATFIWLWGVGGYYILKYFNQKEIPGIHTGLGEGVKKELGNITAGEGADAGGAEAENEGEKKGSEERKSQNQNGGPKEGKSDGQRHHSSHQARKSDGGGSANPKEAADVGKHVGKASSAAKGVTGQ